MIHKEIIPLIESALAFSMFFVSLTEFGDKDKQRNTLLAAIFFMLAAIFFKS